MGAAKATIIVAHGTHIKENLQHHKASDVKRILEDKGFVLSDNGASDNGTKHYKMPNSPDNGKCTRVSFDDQGFVTGKDGIVHFEEPES